MKLNRLEETMKVNHFIVKKMIVIKIVTKTVMEKMIKNKTNPKASKIDLKIIKIKKTINNKLRINKINSLNNKNQLMIRNLM
jgi:predicted RNase H-like nuclease